MFNTKTNQGWEILSTIQHKGKTHIVVKRAKDYAWGKYYNVETGSWDFGYYDYSSPELALQDLIENIFNKKLVEEEKPDSLTFNEMLDKFVETKIEEAKEEECQIDSGDFRSDFVDGLLCDYVFELQEAYKKYQEATEEFEEV